MSSGARPSNPLIEITHAIDWNQIRTRRARGPTGQAGAPVVRWLGPDDMPQGEWEFTVGGDYGDATIVVSGLAPVTTEPAAYSFSVTPLP